MFPVTQGGRNRISLALPDGGVGRRRYSGMDSGSR